MLNKSIFWFLILFIIGCSLHAQNTDLPPYPKPGKCYIKHTTEHELTEWKAIKCEYLELDAQSIQHKLKNLGYNVEITNYLDYNTIIAYKQYLKDEKKRLRLEKKLKRKTRKT